MEKKKWLVISYSLPAEPSRHRVSTWRALKKLGAVNIQQSMWVLAYSNENFQALEAISTTIESNQGEAFLMECTFFDEKQEEKVVNNFNELRDEEYREFISECEKYFKELDKEIKNEKFTFAELEEEEEELEKLIAWYEKIKARDLFQSQESSVATSKLKQAKKAFDGYSELVYNNRDRHR